MRSRSATEVPPNFIAIVAIFRICPGVRGGLCRQGVSPAQPLGKMTESASIDPSIDPGEVAKFSAIAAEWWDPTGKFAPLHKFNPVRLGFIRAEAAAHFGRDARGLRPFEGLNLLDIGCGGGLLSEPMARLGFAVTGADASERNIGTARAHAAQSGLAITYRAASAEQLAAEGLSFDLVLNMEVIEHVADVSAYLAACAALVKPGGLTIVATLNKTLKSLALAKIGAEYVLGWLPRGTHDWNRFIPPAQLRAALEQSGLMPLKTQGVSFNPLTWDWLLSSDTGVNYMVVAGR
jgi:2-polyprenyl-6-hydroxyphenyl methylase/3-demethylubiquinone-9 3-methyltransferase